MVTSVSTNSTFLVSSEELLGSLHRILSLDKSQGRHKA